MRKVLLTSFGSTGDIYPLLSLGKGLVEHGDHVTLAAAELYKPEIEASGITFVSLPPYLTKKAFDALAEMVSNAHNEVDLLKKLFGCLRNDLPACIQILDTLMRESDLFIGSYILPFLGQIADKHGVPFYTLAFCHQSIPSPDYAPYPLPNLPFPCPPLYRFLWNLSESMVDRTINSILEEPLIASGLKPVKGFFNEGPIARFVCVSSSLMKPQQARISENSPFIGYLRHQPLYDPALAETLDSFTRGECVPLINFGSMIQHHAQKKLDIFLSTWPKQNKLIIQNGWAKLNADSHPNALTLGKVSHDQLFQYASVVVHHGGAGTTASVLHAGKPHIIVPHIGDQFFWAKEVRRLQCGVRCNLKHWPKRLSGTIQSVLADQNFALNAKKHAQKLAKENGLAMALKLLNHVKNKSHVR